MCTILLSLKYLLWFHYLHGITGKFENPENLNQIISFLKVINHITQTTNILAAALAFPGNKLDVKAITDRNKKKPIVIESQLCDFYSNAIISDKFLESQVAQALQNYERQCT